MKGIRVTWLRIHRHKACFQTYACPGTCLDTLRICTVTAAMEGCGLLLQDRVGQYTMFIIKDKHYSVDIKLSQNNSQYHQFALFNCKQDLWNLQTKTLDITHLHVQQPWWKQAEYPCVSLFGYTKTALQVACCRLPEGINNYRHRHSNSQGNRVSAYCHFRNN